MTKPSWYTVAALRWFLALGLMMGVGWLLRPIGWPLWTKLVAEFVATAFVLAFVVQWPLLFEKHLEVRRQIEDEARRRGQREDERPRR